MACYGQCYSGHIACICNAQCGCHSDWKTCNSQRHTNNSRVFAWNRTLAPGLYILATDIIQLRSFLQQEQNARSTPAPAPINGTYDHPGSCSVQTTSWTGTVSVGSIIYASTFNELVSLMISLKARANQQHASVTVSNPATVAVGEYITAAYGNALRQILIQSYQQCICASKIHCNCQLLCPCQHYRTCSCNGAVCSCHGQCSCVTYNCGCNGYY